MSHKAGILPISSACLERLLGFREGVRITHIIPQDGPDLLSGRFRVMISGDGLPDCPEGGVPQSISLDDLR